MASIAEFTSQFQGGARPSLYNVILPFPALAGAGGDVTTKLQFTCKGAQLPGTDFGMIDVPYMGRNIKLAGDRTFQELQLTIINDIGWEVRTAFERWMQSINGHSENKGATKLSEYAVDAIIEQLGRDGNVIATYTFVGAWPMSLAPIDLGYDMVDTIEEYGVTIAFQYWLRAEAGVV